MPYVTCTKNIDDMPIYPGVMGAFVPGQSIYVHDSVVHVYVGNPDFTISDQEPAIAALGARVDKARLAMIGRVPMTMTGIGNSMMTVMMPWWMVCCEKSNGMIRQYNNGHGVAGNTTAQMLARKAEVPAAVDLVVIQESTNDVILAVSKADHIANMRGLIEFYIGRGQIPIICRPPQIASGAANNKKIYEFGLIDFFLAEEYGVPFVDPWTQFVVEATGFISAAVMEGDGIHPLNATHATAGATMYSQLTAGMSVIPLPVATSVYGTFEVVTKPLMDTAWDTFGAGATGSIVTDAAIPGNWQRATATGAGRLDITHTIYGSVQAGDEVLCVGKLKSSAELGVCGLGVLSLPSNTQMGFFRYINGPADGTFLAKGVFPSGQTAIQFAFFMQNATVGKTADIAQCQIFNKTQIMSR